MRLRCPCTTGVTRHTGTPETFLRSVAPNLMQYTRMTRGGHFAAVEEPKALADDVLRFVSALNSGVGQQ